MLIAESRWHLFHSSHPSYSANYETKKLENLNESKSDCDCDWLERISGLYERQIISGVLMVAPKTGPQ